ncbi:MAG TPA: hypothetical protein VFE65_00990 [Pseudonocardia sp.]|jgi:hypothetical protein|nr:hypothetical protein [Pseudonocardia sp.]
MIRRFTVTALVGAAAAATLLVPAAAGSDAAVTPVAMTTALQPADPPHGPGPGPGPHGDRNHGPGWDGRHGNWDGRGGFGRGGGWDGNGGGWDGHRWWVSRDRCQRGHGHPNRERFGWICRGGYFNGAPIR